jgi:phosphatidylserine/phosphatidylglycerophosphate/cardiolipin synthase-like enzyme
MIGVGRLASFGRDPSDVALSAMMDAARSTIRISQQDIGSVPVLGLGVFPEAYLDAFTRAAARGVDVEIVLSNPRSFGGHGVTQEDSYSNGWDLQSVWKALVQRADQQSPGHDADLCQHVHLSYLRSSAAETWPDRMPLANHAKVVIIDDQAFYVGSQNLYKADLAEYGVIVDDAATTQQFVAEYYAKLAQHSQVTEYSDAACNGTGAHCSFGGVSGNCQDVSACTGGSSPHPGLCPGPANIQCCTPN